MIFLKSVVPSGKIIFATRNLTHVFPDLGYEVMNMSFFFTLTRRPGGVKPTDLRASRCIFRVLDGALIMESLEFLINRYYLKNPGIS